jgi:hypothetical protein
LFGGAVRDFRSVKSAIKEKIGQFPEISKIGPGRTTLSTVGGKRIARANGSSAFTGAD